VDIRDAVRALRATPIVTIVAIISLALGIGANTAIFSILDSLVIRTLPVRGPHRLALLGRGSEGQDAWTNPIWEEVRAHKDLVGDIFACSITRFNVSATPQTEYVDGLWASGGFFDALGVQAMLGRTFGEADDARGGGPAGPVAVISYRFWQSRFGGAADAIGRSVTIEHTPFTIVGVTPPEFFGLDVGRTFDVAVPIGTEPLIRRQDSALDKRTYWWLQIMVRLKPEQSLESATATLRGVQPQVREATLDRSASPEYRRDHLREPFTLITAASGMSGLRERYQKPLVTMMAVVLLVLLIACANIANLLLARASARRHEMSVRLALGASRLRLTRQLLAESVLLAGCGAALGVIVAQWGIRLLVRQLSTSTNTVFLDTPIDVRVLGFTAAVAGVTALLFGTAPALRASRVQPSEVLKAHGRGVTDDRRFGLGSLLVALQVAMSLILVVAAGLFVRTFTSLAHLDLGFNRNPVLVVNVGVDRIAADALQRAHLYERLWQAAQSVPGVKIAAASAVTPISGNTWQVSLHHIDDGPVLGETERGVYVNAVTPGWFDTYGTQFIAGRDFTVLDAIDAPPVLIVNEAFARKFLNGQHPLGHRVRQLQAPPVDREIVGYVRDAVYRSLRAPMPPTMYVPLRQQPNVPPGISISVRAAAGAPALLTRSLATSLMDVNRDISLTVRPLADQVNNALSQERVIAMLSGFFGALALLLAALGLYGVTAYGVNRRKTELGIRLALGATPASVVRLVLRRVALLVGAGVMVGGGAGLATAKYVATLLYGLQPRDPLTFASAAAILCAIGALAGWLPARRASRLDPARVLRES
jgi:predicted permease